MQLLYIDRSLYPPIYLYLYHDHRFRPEIPDLLYCPVWWCHLPWSSNWGIQVFADYTHGNKRKQNASLIFAHIPVLVSHALQFFTCIYLHAQTAVHACDICTWRIPVISITGKTYEHPPTGVTCQEENGTDSWISGKTCNLGRQPLCLTGSLR